MLIIFLSLKIRVFIKIKMYKNGIKLKIKNILSK